MGLAGSLFGVPAQAEKGRTCSSGGSSQPRVDIVPTTVTTGSGSTLKQPCRPCPSPFRLIHWAPLDRPAPRQPPILHGQHRTIRNQPRTTHPPRLLRPVWLSPLQPCPQTPFSAMALPPIHATLGLCSQNVHYRAHSDADERPETTSPVPVPRVGQAKQPCKRIHSMTRALERPRVMEQAPLTRSLPPGMPKRQQQAGSPSLPMRMY